MGRLRWYNVGMGLLHGDPPGSPLRERAVWDSNPRHED